MQRNAKIATSKQVSETLLAEVQLKEPPRRTHGDLQKRPMQTRSSQASYEICISERLSAHIVPACFHHAKKTILKRLANPTALSQILHPYLWQSACFANLFSQMNSIEQQNAMQLASASSGCSFVPRSCPSPLPCNSWQLQALQKHWLNRNEIALGCMIIHLPHARKTAGARNVRNPKCNK